MAKATANPAGAKVLKENSGNILSISDSDNISGVVIFIIAGCLIFDICGYCIKEKEAEMSWMLISLCCIIFFSSEVKMSLMVLENICNMVTFLRRCGISGYNYVFRHVKT